MGDVVTDSKGCAGNCSVCDLIERVLEFSRDDLRI
jgi:hypothetical protein